MSEIEQELERQLKILNFGISEITPEDEFKKMLKHSLENNKPLRVKCGIDPTGTDVHLGHLVPYRKMRQFQDLGHTGVVIIGDYTAQIGDPSGKNESRPPLSAEQAKANAKRYMEQVFTVLDEKKTEVRFQSEWFGDKTLADCLMWAGETTVAKLLSHETFRDRLEQGNSLGLHELFYPVLQGIDSVYIDADVELGGTDQKFNVLMGRDYHKHRNKRPQVAMLLPIVTGLCGTQKMSKSLGNYIGILDDAFDKFGKVMSIPDDLMLEYYKYIAGVSEEEFSNIESSLKNKTLHPNEAKKQLAERIVSFFHGDEEGAKMREQFEAVFKKGQVPDDIDEHSFNAGETVMSVLTASGLLKSNGEVRRMAKQGAISIMEGEKISDPEMVLGEDFRGMVIKVGKRKFLKLI
jgi:tyrosyl-tRNA synthetase